MAFLQKEGRNAFLKKPPLQNFMASLPVEERISFDMKIKKLISYYIYY